MYRRFFTALVTLFSFTLQVSAQQFIGMPAGGYTGIQQVPYNPSWVNNARTGVEVNVFGVNVFAINNAYGVNSRLIFHPGDSAVQGIDYFKLKNTQNKKGWANADILGPSFSFTYKKKYQFGIYSRFRTVVNAGNMTSHLFDLFTEEDNPIYHYTDEFNKTGASAHAFGELGFTAGQMLRDDEYHKLSVGVTVKYIMGFAGFSLYTKNLKFSRENDSIGYLQGDLTALYTYNTNPSSTSDLAQRAGKGSLGLDIGAHYEYYPDVDPNKPAEYKFSIAASITDIGSASYVADKGSAAYTVKTGSIEVSDLGLADADRDEFSLYTARKMELGELAVKQKYEKFKIGLPTAFRANFDYNFGQNVYVSVNTLLNLRGNNGKVYHPGYASYINVTPRFDHGNVKLSLPLTFMRYRTFALGTIFNLGPFYLGSSTSLSSILLGSNITTIDIYTGFTIKFSNKERKEQLHMFDYRGVDDPNRGLRKFIPRFLRRNSGY